MNGPLPRTLGFHKEEYFVAALTRKTLRVIVFGNEELRTEFYVPLHTGHKNLFLRHDLKSRQLELYDLTVKGKIVWERDESYRLFLYWNTRNKNEYAAYQITGQMDFHDFCVALKDTHPKRDSYSLMMDIEFICWEVPRMRPIRIDLHLKHAATYPLRTDTTFKVGKKIFRVSIFFVLCS